MFTAIVIDDERIARNRLKRLLERFDDVDIISESDNGKSAIEEINLLKPDLVFLDIQMPELSGFEVLERLEHQPAVIFTTAYDQYALKAFEVNSIDYLMKPIEEERLVNAVSKVKKILSTEKKEDYSSLLNYITQEPIDQFTVRFGDKVLFLSIEDVTYFESKDKSVLINTTNGESYVIDYTLQVLEKKLDKKFIRIHRSFLINRKRIVEAYRLGNSKYEFKMKDNTHTTLRSSIGYSEEIKRLFSL